MSRHCFRASGEAASAGGLRNNSLAAASAPPLAACEGALDGRPDSCRRAALHGHSCPWSRNARGVWRGGRHTLRHLYVVHTNHGDEEEMNYDQLKAPTWRAKCRGAATTAGWRKAPALAQRVCTRGLASPRSISPKNTMNTARFRVVRAAGA